MKMFRFVKKSFFVGLTILSGLADASSLNAIPLSCISKKIKNVKQDHKLSRTNETKYIDRMAQNM